MSNYEESSINCKLGYVPEEAKTMELCIQALTNTGFKSKEEHDQFYKGLREIGEKYKGDSEAFERAKDDYLKLHFP